MVDRDGCEQCTKTVHTDCVAQLTREEGVTVCERRINGLQYASLIVNGKRTHSSGGFEDCCDAISDLLMRVRRSQAERGPDFVGGA